MGVCPPSGSRQTKGARASGSFPSKPPQLVDRGPELDCPPENPQPALGMLPLSFPSGPRASSLSVVDPPVMAAAGLCLLEIRKCSVAWPEKANTHKQKVIHIKNTYFLATSPC